MQDCIFISFNVHESQMKELGHVFRPLQIDVVLGILLWGSSTPGFTAQSYSHCSKQVVTTKK